MQKLVPVVISMCAAVCVLVCLPRAQAQFFVNGDFEAGPTRGNVGASTTAVFGWTTTVGGGNGASVYNGNNTLETWVPNAQSGTYCIQLDGSSLGSDTGFGSDNALRQTSVYQTFTAPAGSYTLKFYISGEAGTSKTGVCGVLVSLSGVATGALSRQEFTFNNTGATAGSWTLETSAFTVTNPNAQITLTFADDPNTALANYTNSSDIAIDNVTIPEPSSLVGCVLAAGGLALGCIRRRAVSV